MPNSPTTTSTSTAPSSSSAKAKCPYKVFPYKVAANCGNSETILEGRAREAKKERKREREGQKKNRILPARVCVCVYVCLSLSLSLSLLCVFPPSASSFACQNFFLFFLALLRWGYMKMELPLMADGGFPVWFSF